MFSVGGEDSMNAYHHAQAREILVNDVCQLHEKAIQRQKCWTEIWLKTAIMSIKQIGMGYGL